MLIQKNPLARLNAPKVLTIQIQDLFHLMIVRMQSRDIMSRLWDLGLELRFPVPQAHISRHTE